MRRPRSYSRPTTRGALAAWSWTSASGGAMVSICRTSSADGTRAYPSFMTGYGDVPTSVRAFKGGAIDFLRKPVPPKALLERISEALRLDAQARDATAQHAELADRIAREPEEGDDRREATGCRASRSGA